MQPMKWKRVEPPLKAEKPREYGRAEPPVRRVDPEALKGALMRDALGVRAPRPEEPAAPQPSPVIREAVARRVQAEEVVRARVSLPEAEQPEEAEVLSWMAEQASDSLAPCPHILDENGQPRARAQAKAGLFSKTRNINERPKNPFVQAADPVSAVKPAKATRARAAFPSGIFRRADKKGGRKDPAPSRLRYRMDRLWLTPLFRAFLRTGLPAFVIVFAAGMYLANDDRRAALTDTAEGVVRSVQERPEFMVKLMAIEGASPELADTIRATLPVRFPVTSFDLDLEELRGVVAGLDAVQSAEVRVKPGGILEVRVAERTPALLWRGPEGLMMLDATGHPVSEAGSRLERLDLPVVAGAGADRAVPEALELIDAAAPVAPRLRGLVRMGERRWDVVLDNGQRILLPEEGALEALQRVMALAIAEDMLSRDVSVVDMRFTARPTLRMAPKSLGQFRQEEAGATNG